MKRRTAALLGVTALVAAASLLVVGTASAGTATPVPTIGCSAPAKKQSTRSLANARAEFVRGVSYGDTMTGSLVGTYSYAETQLVSYSYDQRSGIMRFSLVNETFTGTVNGVQGKVVLKGTIVQFFVPGTPEGDAFVGIGWKGGGCYHEITAGEGDLASASGFLIFKDRSYGGDSDYWGVIRL